ncbi:MATE efflux family protein [Fusobacterium necrophorum subsp. funduliforme B35]|uniref:MATE family efflux transporter n=1 Tax=Fusobacterium necrophorum TaxID=859 RepID=UPI000432863A|nr:MATE family efflux transporter [Fusobacterium necrophorum]EYD70117.1 MATE efflux family protein [Fusobacterium necrophorum subsp. funduliforme B35]
MNLILDFFSSFRLLEQEKTEQEIPSKKKIKQEYWRVALPTAVEGVLLNLMLLADLIMVGSLGIEQAAAVGIVSQPKMILQMIMSAAGVAITAIVARRKGEGDEEGLNSCIKQSLLLLGILYFFFVCLSFLFSKNIVSFAGANKDYVDYASIYFQYIALSVFFKVFCVVLSSAQIGVGNTKVVLISGMIGNGLNVLFNYILIFGKFGFPAMGIQGAAIATVLGNFVIFIILLYSTTRGDYGIDILRKGSYSFSKKILKPLQEIGTNSFLEHVFERIGLFIFAKMIASLGTVAMGTHHYCILLWDLYYYFGVGMSSASASFTGRKLGEKRKDLAILYMRAAQYSGFWISICVGIIFFLLRNMIFSVMVSDTRVILLGSSVMLIISFLLIPQTQAQVTAGVLRGAGDNRFIAIYSLFISAILRPCLAYIFVFLWNFGLVGIWLAFFSDEFLKMLLAQYRVQKGIWLQKEI